MKLQPHQYSSINPLRWSDEEIEKRTNWTCPDHRHIGLKAGHSNCYNKAHGIKERKGCVDIEASNLKADFGVILSWCIKTVGTDEVWYDCMTPKDVTSDLKDSRITESLIDTIWKYDRLIGHYSCRFDIPFIRTRAIHWGMPFPTHGMIWHTDTWLMARSKLCISSNRQGNVAQAVQDIDIKTRIRPDIWLDVQFGSNKVKKKALDYVLDHNVKDVEQLEGNYLGLLPYVTERRTSI